MYSVTQATVAGQQRQFLTCRPILGLGKQILSQHPNGVLLLIYGVT